MPYSPVADTLDAGAGRPRSRHVATLYAVTLTLLLAACASGPPPTLYLLEPVEPRAKESRALADVSAIGVSTVRLPDYAGDSQVVTQTIDRSLSRDDRERWAESPDRALTRALAAGLRARTEAGVAVEPWPRGFEPDRRVDIVFDRLLRTSDGGSSMRGQIQVSSGDGREIVALEPFVIEQPANARDTLAFFDATATGIDRLAAMVFEILAAGAVDS